MSVSFYTSFNYFLLINCKCIMLKNFLLFWWLMFLILPWLLYSFFLDHCSFRTPGISHTPGIPRSYAKLPSLRTGRVWYLHIINYNVMRLYMQQPTHTLSSFLLNGHPFNWCKSWYLCWLTLEVFYRKMTNCKIQNSYTEYIKGFLCYF